MVTNAALEKKLDAFHQWCLRRLLRLSYLRHVANVEVCARRSYLRLCGTGVYVFLVISRGPTADWTIHVFFDPSFLDCHAIGNDLPVDRGELRIVNGGSGQWKRLRSSMGHALDDDDDETLPAAGLGSVTRIPPIG